MKVYSSDSGSSWRARLGDPSRRVKILLSIVAFSGCAVGLLVLGALFRSEIGEIGRTILESPLVIRNRTVAAIVARPTIIRLDLSHRNYQKLSFKREQALEVGRLITTDDDWVSADLSYADSKVGVKIRLKGDWLDHLDGEEWSFRVDARDDGTVMGMERLSLQKPGTRNFINEWIFHRLLQHEGLIGLRYQFVELVLNGRNLGIYALEEHFDKRLIENNQLREGPIVRFDEQMLFQDGYDPRIDDLEPHDRHHGAGSYQASPVEGFRTQRALADSASARSYIEAVNLLEAFRSGAQTAAEVFDVGKLGTFLAVCDVAGGQHAMLWHNVRFYLNPISGKLEPIGFDAVAGIPIKELSLFRAGSGENGLNDQLGSDPSLLAEYVTALERLSMSETLDAFFDEIDDDLRAQMTILHLEEPRFELPMHVYHGNQAFIRRRIHPTAGLHAYRHPNIDGALTLEIGNIQQLPIRLEAVTIGDSNAVRVPVSHVFAGRQSSRPVEYAVISVDGVAEGPPSTMTIEYLLEGSSRVITSTVFPYPRVASSQIPVRSDTPVDDLDRLEFVSVDVENRVISFDQGDWMMDRPLRLPPGYRVLVTPGTSLDLRSGAYLQSKSPIRMVGSVDMPIRLHSSDGSGGGLVLLGAESESVLESVEFDNLANPMDGAWTLTGAVTFYESPVRMLNCLISNSRAEDALNIVRSDFDLNGLSISRSASDALDIDFSSGHLQDVHFSNSGNDGVDASGSAVTMNSVSIRQSGDKGLSVGESSVVTATDIEIRGSFIGIAAKDLSTIDVSRGLISDTNVGLAVFQKKSEFGPADMTVSEVRFENTINPFLVESGSRLDVDSAPRSATGDSVFMRLYPNLSTND